MVAMVGLTMMPIFETDRIQLGYYPFLIFRHFLMGLLFLVVILFSFQVNWKTLAKKIFKQFYSSLSNFL
jgi:hypothetical protein